VAIAHFSKVFAFQDAKVYPLLTDPPGGAATYGTGIDVPGVQALEISGDVETKELRGDNALLDVFAILKNVKGKLGYAKLSLDLFAAWLGGAVVDAGSGSTETATWDLTGDSTVKNWKIEGKTPTDGVDLIGGDLHVVFHKAVLGSFPGAGLAMEDYQLQSVDFATTPLLATGKKWMTVVLNETASAIV
jgi:hypothetical protein